jgi:hypothetical protein
MDLKIKSTGGTELIISIKNLTDNYSKEYSYKKNPVGYNFLKLNRKICIIFSLIKFLKEYPDYTELNISISYKFLFTIINQGMWKVLLNKHINKYRKSESFFDLASQLSILLLPLLKENKVIIRS